MWTGPPNGDVTGSRHRRNSLARCRCPATYATCPTGHPGPLPSVAPIDLHLRAGTLLAVTGPSGAGKSSLLWALAGALDPAAGAVSVDGSPLTGRDDAAARGVSLIPQGNGLAGSLSAEENVLVPMLARKVSPRGGARRQPRADDRRPPGRGRAGRRGRPGDPRPGGRRRGGRRARARRRRGVMAPTSGCHLSVGAAR